MDFACHRTYLASDCVEKGVNNALREAFLLILVHIHDLSPVRGNFWQMQALAKIYKVKNIFLEARTTKADGGTKEFVPNTRIVTDSVCNFIDVGTSGLADGRESVDGGDTLGEHCIGGQLGELR
jgi:hypothetical protein